MSYTYSADALASAHTALRDDLNDGALVILDASDVELARVTLDNPSGTVDLATGTLTFTILSQEDSAPASGTADHAELRTSGGVFYLRMPCTEGTSAVSGECVMNTLNVVEGTSVEVVSLVIG